MFKQGLFFVLFLIVLTSICDTINQLFLKSAINSLQVSLKGNIRAVLRFIARLLLVPRVWLSFFFSFVSLCIWLFVLSRIELNLAFSLDSMHYIFIGLGSSFFLKEKVGLGRWIGISSIILGIILVSLSF